MPVFEVMYPSKRQRKAKPEGDWLNDTCRRFGTLPEAVCKARALLRAGAGNRYAGRPIEVHECEHKGGVCLRVHFVGLDDIKVVDTWSRAAA